MKFSKLFINWKNMPEFQEGEVIYSQGDPANAMYFIMKGEVELRLHNEALGKEKAGGIIGETAIIASAVRSATATAMGDVKLARVNRREFKELIAANGDFSLHVMTILANRLRAVDKYISKQIKQHK